MKGFVMYKYIFFVSLTFFLVGCSPKYVIKNQYIPAQEKSFAQCANNCEKEKMICEQDCSNIYQTCLNDAYTRAKDISGIEFVKYDNLYEEYLFKLRDYESYKHKFNKKYKKTERDFVYFKNQCIKTKDLYACKRQRELHNTLTNMKQNMLQRPFEPRRPSFKKILYKQQSYCKSDCGCSSSFDRCYINCGGEIVPYRLCISNCD